VCMFEDECWVGIGYVEDGVFGLVEYMLLRL
jgi:hypothetical protein